MRRSQLILALSVFFTFCLPGGLGCETGECSTDNDCKGDRVCTDGECVGPATTAPEDKIPCGVIDVVCNCAGVSGVGPGSVTSAPRCESGRHVFEACGYCSPGYAWQTRCTCDAEPPPTPCEDEAEGKAFFAPFTCPDGACGIDAQECSDLVFAQTCGGLQYHCPSGAYANCCGDIFAPAPAAYPFFCSLEGMFTDDPSKCTSQTCTFQASLCP